MSAQRDLTIPPADAGTASERRAEADEAARLTEQARRDREARVKAQAETDEAYQARLDEILAERTEWYEAQGKTREEAQGLAYLDQAQDAQQMQPEALDACRLKHGTDGPDLARALREEEALAQEAQVIDETDADDQEPAAPYVPPPPSAATLALWAELDKAPDGEARRQILDRDAEAQEAREAAEGDDEDREWRAKIRARDPADWDRERDNDRRRHTLHEGKRHAERMTRPDPRSDAPPDCPWRPGDRVRVIDNMAEWPDREPSAKALARLRKAKPNATVYRILRDTFAYKGKTLKGEPLRGHRLFVRMDKPVYSDPWLDPEADTMTWHGNPIPAPMPLAPEGPPQAVPTLAPAPVPPSPAALPVAPEAPPPSAPWGQIPLALGYRPAPARPPEPIGRGTQLALGI